MQLARSNCWQIRKWGPWRLLSVLLSGLLEYRSIYGVTSLIETECHHGKSIENNHSALPTGSHHVSLIFIPQAARNGPHIYLASSSRVIAAGHDSCADPKSPGLGVEFETGNIQFTNSKVDENKNCSPGNGHHQNQRPSGQRQTRQ